MVIGTELKRGRTARRGIIEIDTPEACEIFIQAIMEFRRRKRYSQFIQVKHVAPLLKKGKGMWASFQKVVEHLELIRCSVQLDPYKFYRIASEFTIDSRGLKFFPVRQLFGDGELQEDFLRRAYDTFTWICDLCDDEGETDWVISFINLVKEKVRVFDNAIDYKSKDWYCIKSIVRFNDVKEWTENGFLDKLKRYYGGRRKKVTAEMMLWDLAHGEMDVLLTEEERNEIKEQQQLEKQKLKEQKKLEREKRNELIAKEKEQKKLEKRRLKELKKEKKQPHKIKTIGVGEWLKK